MPAVPGWVDRLPPGVPTPTVVVDLAVLEENLHAMASVADRAGAALRPHAKTHKCRPIARRQLDAGAVGLSVATVGEAEYFADDGAEDIFIAYPVWTDPLKGRRLAALAERVRLRIGVDSPAGAAALGRHVNGRRDAALEVLVEVDSGHHRSGVPPSAVPTVASACERAGLAVAGVFTFPGHAYAPGAPRAAAADEGRALSDGARLLGRTGSPPAIRSGGSTPTALLSNADQVDELRPGVYVFNDAQQLRLGTCAPSQVALVVMATVVSRPAPERFILDAGSKALGTDRPPWMPGHGLLPDLPRAVVHTVSEHHGVVDVNGEASRRGLPPVGSRVAVVPNHVCTAVNLADELLVVRAGTIEDRWPVAPRRTNG